MPDWPHQTRMVQQTIDAIERGVVKFVATAPTGAGKTRYMLRIAEWGEPTVVYSNRRMLIEQLSENFEAAGIKHGVHMSGYGRTVWQNVQIASVQSAHTWWKSSQAELPEAKYVIIDEAHNETGKRFQELMEAHLERGAEAIIGLTATPIGLSWYDELLVGAVTSELRKCGALVPAVVYAPDEPSMASFKPKTKGILQFKDEYKEVMLPVIFGRCIEHYHIYNPDQRPSIGFADSVASSQWFAERFTAAGVPSAHIDGERIWMDGESMESSRENRRRLAEASKNGRIKTVWNRFVLREGIDWPWLYHAMFACTYGSLKAYLQSGGRLLRNHESLDHVVVQDHGGNWWRHDSLNCDREWHLDDTENQIAGERAEKFRTKAEPEPITCPQCSAVRRGGASCSKCGFTYKGKKRLVIETDGSLREVRGDIYKPRKVSEAPEAHKTWIGCYFRCKRSGKTFAQARGLFMREMNYQVPGDDFPLMPKRPADWHRKVCDVPREELTPYQKAKPQEQQESLFG